MSEENAVDLGLRLRGYNYAEWAIRGEEEDAREIASLQRQIKELRSAKHRKDKRAELLKAFRLVDKLQRAGFAIQSYADPTWIRIEITAKELPLLYKTVGKVKMSSKDVENFTEGTIRVSVKSDAYPMLRASYVKELPPPSKCKIVASTNTHYSLVCER